MEKSSAGRPAAEIDWKKVEDLLVAGCMGTGIAAYLGISAQTLYDRCLIEKKMLFSQFSQEKKEKGDEILRAHQYAKALGLTDKGDNTLLIWLGKTRLKQRENPLELEHSLTVTTIDYSEAKEYNNPSQIHSEELSTSGSEST